MLPKVCTIAVFTIKCIKSIIVVICNFLKNTDKIYRKRLKCNFVLCACQHYKHTDRRENELYR